MSPVDIFDLCAAVADCVSIRMLFYFSCSVSSHRGPASEWHDSLIAHFRHCRSVRIWFIQNILFAQPSRISEYLLESPSNEVSIIKATCEEEAVSTRYLPV